MKRRTLLSSAAVVAVPLLPLRAMAATTRIDYGYTAAADFASVFVAVEQGYFGKRGLEVAPQLIPIGSNIPAALESDSLQIGGLTPSTFLSAVDGGLNLVAIAGGSMSTKAGTELGLVARTGSGIHSAQDCVGKKIGGPGLGAALHVIFRAWLIANHVDYHKVTFVEAAFPQHADLLRGGSVDAVISADPFMTRIVDSGSGYVASYFSTFLPDGQQKALQVARRDWMEKNTQAAHAFREALVEAAAFMRKPANDPSVRSAIGKYIKLPPSVLAKIAISPPSPIVTEAQMSAWIQLMNQQDMLKSQIDAKSLVMK